MKTAAAVMTPRERWFETLLFGSPDKIPFNPGGPRESTLKAWRSQGLPANRRWNDFLYEQLGLPRDEFRQERLSPGVDFRMLPRFEEKVLEHKDGHYIVLDWMGNITEISDEYDYTYIRQAKDFVTRRWLKFPVENRADFEEMKKRYDPETPGRFPEDFTERCKKLRQRDYPVLLRVAGPFWQLREWCGFEPLCMFFIDDPDFVREMCAFWEDFVSQTLAPILDAGIIDGLGLSEDMAYKEKPMISPQMAREFLQPCYDHWLGEAKSAGVRIFDMDSDGRVDLLLPLWVEAGFNVCDPMEVAAGNDLMQLRRRFGKRLAYTGGVDKRRMAEGGKSIETELERLAPVIADGGYIPGCDHGVPPDVSWPNFLHYSRLLAELTGWL